MDILLYYTISILSGALFFWAASSTTIIKFLKAAFTIFGSAGSRHILRTFLNEDDGERFIKLGLKVFGVLVALTMIVLITLNPDIIRN